MNEKKCPQCGNPVNVDKSNYCICEECSTRLHLTDDKVEQEYY